MELRIVTLLAAALLTLMMPKVAADCSSELAAITGRTLNITEGVRNDTPVLNFTDIDDLEMTPDNHPILRKGIDGIYTIMPIEVDGEENEVLCRQVNKSIASIQLQCTGIPSSRKELFPVVTFTDDHPPVLSPNLEASVRELLPPGSVVIDMSKDENAATDPDCDTGSYFYSVDDPFTANGKVIVLLKELDYEQTQEYNVSITVTSQLLRPDLANPSKSTTSTLVVKVEDVDDQPPVFDNKTFVLHVPEEMDLSSGWRTATPPIFARDGDVGLNVNVTYSLDTVKPNLKMKVNNETGDILITETLDRETNGSYIAIVKATQVDKSTMSATATLSIIVDDINDNRPRFTSQQSTNATIREDTPAGTFVLGIYAEDDDEGVNATFDININSSTDGYQMFEVIWDTVSKHPWLVVKDSQALRGQTDIHLQLLLVEKALVVGPATCDFISTCATDITVHILDVNDNSPIFTESRYDFSIWSNHSTDAVVGKVEASDADRGDNARIQYSLNPITNTNDCQKLKIHSASGEITVADPLTAGVECSLLAVACDSPSDGSVRRCTTVPVIVIVTPGGSMGQLDVNIAENVPIGTVVTVLPISGLSTTSQDFEIRQNVLHTKAELDRETKDSYEVEVFTNTGNEEQLAMRINVDIDDINDNAPVFGESTYVVNIDSSVNFGDVVLQVNATDKDIGKNAELRYSLISGSQYFSIDATSGRVTLINEPTVIMDAIKSASNNNGNIRKSNDNGSITFTQTMDFHLKVTDSGTPSLQGQANLTVYSPLYNETTAVDLPVPRETLMAERKKAEEELSGILGVNVKIHNIENLGRVPELGSKVFISATKQDGSEVEPTELNSLLDRNAEKIHQAFLKYSPNDVTNSDDEPDDIFTVPFIIVLAACGLLLLLVIIAFVVAFNRHRKYKRHVSLFDRLNNDTSIYDTLRKPSDKSSELISNHNHNSVHSNNNNNNIDSTTDIGGDSDGTTALLSNGSVTQNGSVRQNGTTDADIIENGGTNAFVNPTYTHDERSPAVSPPKDDDATSAASGLQGNYTVQPDDLDTLEVPADYPDAIDENQLRSSQSSGERVTRFGSQIIDEVTTVSNPVHKTTIEVKHYPRLSASFDTDRASPVESGLGNSAASTPRSENAQNSPRESENSNEDNHHEDDETDKEVATILTKLDRATNLSELPQSNGNAGDTSGSKPFANVSAIDLMKPTRGYTSGPSANNTSGNTTAPDSLEQADSQEMPEEPEPDYAKRVRFNEATKIVIAKDEQDNDDQNPAGQGDGDGGETSYKDDANDAINGAVTSPVDMTNFNANSVFVSTDEVTQM